MSIEAPFLTKADITGIVRNTVPNERQMHWQNVLQMGEYNRYENIQPIKWDALRDATYEWVNNPGEFLKHFGEHIRKIDTDFRGGRDIGDTKIRFERAVAFSGIITLFTAFDYATSKPFKKWLPTRKEDLLQTPADFQNNMTNATLKRLIEVINDKWSTVLGNMLVERLTGERKYIHETSDKAADTIQLGFENTKDWVNGATLESLIRVISQVPIAGALFEQGVTRVARLQEKSAINTTTGKAMYVALGVLIKHVRKSSEGGFSKADQAEIVARAAS